MDTTSVAVAAVCGVIGSLLGQWMLGVFASTEEEHRPMPLGTPPFQRGKLTTPSDIMSYLEQTVDTTDYETKCIHMEGDGCAVITILYKNSEPRAFRMLSRDSFATLDKVTVYEMATLWEAK
jgi:hypothetical protein